MYEGKQEAACLQRENKLFQKRSIDALGSKLNKKKFQDFVGFSFSLGLD